MIDPENILQERLTVLCDEYSAQLEERISQIKEIWIVARFGPSDAEEIRVLKKITHHLATAGSSFGIIAVSDAARNLEQFLTSLLGREGVLTEGYTRQIDILLQTLESAVRNRDSTLQPRPKRKRWDSFRHSPLLQGEEPLIAVLENNLSAIEEIATQLQQRGYRVNRYNNLQTLRQGLTQNVPAVIINGIRHTERKAETAISPPDTGNRNFGEIPLIVISDHDDIDSRLSAVRAGADCYFGPPLEMDRLIDKIGELTTGIPKDPYRIMIIDNDAVMTDFYSFILEQEGMTVAAVNDPLQALVNMHHSRPELILLNMDMEGCSGLELAAILRQQEKYAGISIIFLSTGTDFKQQLAAMNSGGDDFIVTPVDPEFLVGIINSRVSRARTLNTMNNNLAAALREIENQHFALDQHAIVSITNIDGAIIYVNDKFCDISGYSRSELIGKDHHILKSGIHDDCLYAGMWEAITAGTVWQGEICNRKKNGDFYWVNITIVPFMDEKNRPYQYVAINNDITSRILAEQKLKAAHDVAVSANQAKSDFLSKMSHELRTPLNAIMGFSQLLDSSDEHPIADIQKQYVKEIHNAGGHLLNLINEVLDLSRIEVNRLKVENIDIPLAAFMDECSSLVMPLAKQNNITIFKRYEVNHNLTVAADPFRLKQVMVNLLSNAIKYNKPAGTIVIRTHVDTEAEVTIEVIDSGNGIHRDQIDKLFQPFSRLPQHKNQEGVGIGLALSKRLVELMGGRIGVDSRFGAGARFWIKLKPAN
ncbi:MAG: ATP-binding protein [Gammaproteobacteria bacterium]